MNKKKARIPTTKEIEDALESLIKDHPELDWRIRLHYTNMCNNEGEPLFLANIGTYGNPAFIGGTKKQLEERINRFYKQLKDSIP